MFSGKLQVKVQSNVSIRLSSVQVTSIGYKIANNDVGYLIIALSGD